MSLWLCLRFEQLPLQCLSRSEEQAVVVLFRQRVLTANDRAASLGIREGMGSATVRALAGDEAVQMLERNESAEQHCLQQLCCWAYSVTPGLYIWRDNCLQLEIGGCLGLFQGLDSLLAGVSTALGSRSYRVRRGLAPTPKGAWLLSFADNGNAINTEAPLAERLAPLPLKLLNDFPSTVDSLRRAGMHTLGDILVLPPATLGRRCGQSFTRFLQQLLGQREDLQANYQPPTTFSDEYWFGYEVKTNDELLPAAQLLLQSLCRFLRNTQLQTSEINWQLAGIDRKVHEIRVRSTSSQSDWKNWYQLTRIQFNQLQLTGGVEGMTLTSRQLQAGQLDSIDLFTPGNQREPLAALLDRLRSRLGLQAIEKIGCRDEHLPEYTLYVSNQEAADGHEHSPTGSQRPFWLLPQPRRLQNRHGQLHWDGKLNLLYGPERIEDNWWHDAVSRDYYIAAAGDGQRYWIFHDRLAQQWYIHGVFT